MPSSADPRDLTATPSAAAIAGRISVGDPVLHEQMVQPWELCHTPLQRGEFGYRMRYLRLPGITLYRERFDLRCRLLGQSPAATFVVALPLHNDRRSSYWGRRLELPGMLAMVPGGLDVMLDGGHAQLVLLIDSTLLQSHLDSDEVDRLEHAFSNHYLTIGLDDGKGLGQWLSELIDRACRIPDMLHCRALLRSLTAEILLRLVSTVDRSAPTRPRVRPSLRRQAVDRALAYLRQADPSGLTIPQIAQAACVSQRTLEYAFREAFDMTPLAVIRHQRLHAARRELSSASPTRTTVIEVALRNGFHHPARFAAHYRRSFGEAPSITLNRSSDMEGASASPLIPLATSR